MKCIIEASTQVPVRVDVHQPLRLLINFKSYSFVLLTATKLKPLKVVDSKLKKKRRLDVLCTFVYQQLYENLFMSFHKYPKQHIKKHVQLVGLIYNKEELC